MEGKQMGDRALIVVTDNTGEISPAVYTHWAGSEAGDIIKAAGEKGVIRMDDISYATARICAAFVGDNTGTTGTGILAGPENLEPETLGTFSHGDAGVFVLNVTDGSLKQYQGGDPINLGMVKLSR
jgi:hypothetical protein